ncbi:MAG: PKD-like family lipoprotein [Candidatus Cryptobacteroides sp.]
MRRINVFILMVSFLLAAGCYKDLGNYDYKDINRVEISFENPGPYYLILGDELEVRPIYPDFVENNAGNYEFAWYLDGETRPEWNTMDFKWTADKLLDFVRLSIEVKDKTTDVVYMNYVNVNVNGVYTNDDSWMILSDVDGKSRLSFLSVASLLDEDSPEYPEGSEQYYFDNTRFVPDVYVGELGTGPIALQEHWREAIDWSEDVIGNVCVFQESGAVDLEGTGFTKEMDMRNAFVGGEYPAANTVLYPGTFIEFTDVVADQDGKLYSRLKLTSEAYHSEYFLPTPLKVNGEDEALENCTVCSGFYKSNRFGYQVVYDGKNKRMLSLADGSGDWYVPAEGAARITPVSVDPEVSTTGIVPLDNHSGYDLMYLSQYQGGYEGGAFLYGFFEVLKGEDGGLYLQRFLYKKAYGQDPVVSSIKKQAITGLPSDPSVCAFPIYSIQEYAFFAIGNNLYILDLENMTPAEVYYSFDSNITALNYGSGYNVHLAVGLEDGSFYVLGAYKAKNIKDEHKLVYPRTEEDRAAAKTGGKIVDIKFKNNSMPWY